MSLDTNPILILDNGSGYLKCGLSSRQFPEFSLPAIVGRPMLRYEENIEGYQIKVSLIY
jgi:actin-related protein 2